MKTWKQSVAGIVITAWMISLNFGLAIASNGSPMTPELAAKRENFRKQEEQRITPEKRKAAVEALKAERLKVHQAKEAVKQSTPATLEIK